MFLEVAVLCSVEYLLVHFKPDVGLLHPKPLYISLARKDPKYKILAMLLLGFKFK